MIYCIQNDEDALFRWRFKYNSFATRRAHFTLPHK